MEEKLSHLNCFIGSFGFLCLVCQLCRFDTISTICFICYWIFPICKLLKGPLINNVQYTLHGGQLFIQCSLQNTFHTLHCYLQSHKGVDSGARGKIMVSSRISSVHCYFDGKKKIHTERSIKRLRKKKSSPSSHFSFFFLYTFHNQMNASG